VGISAETEEALIAPGVEHIVNVATPMSRWQRLRRDLWTARR
jgi:hypothetical protein